MEKLYDQYVIPPERIASFVSFAIDAPEGTAINEFTVGSTNQAW